MSKPRGKSNTKSRDRHAKDKQEDDGSKQEGALAYTVLSQQDSKELLPMTVGEMQQKLSEVFQLDPVTDLKEAAVLDYYTSATWWAKEQGFTAQQLSGFFSVVHTMMNSVKDSQMSLVECVKELKKMLVGISSDVGSDVPSGGLEFFDVHQAKAITDYMYTSFFQHFKLFEFIFSSPQEEEIVTCDLEVEVPLPASVPFPPPLDEGILESTVQQYMQIPTPSASELASEPGVKEVEEKEPEVEAELPPEVADVFNKLTMEDVREIVDTVATEMLESLQLNVVTKVTTQENQVLTKINKVHNVLPESPAAEESPRAK